MAYFPGVTFQGTAHGKVILLGEHAVVYGVPALVGSLSRGAHAAVEPAQHAHISFGGAPVQEESPLYTALARLTAHFQAPPVSLRLELDIPRGAGLGASAALGVATARALAQLTGRLDETALIEAADLWEQVFHGQPSGVDAAAARLGGILRFERGEHPEPLRLRMPLEVAVCIAGPPAETSAMVELVRRHRQARPESFEQALSGIAALVENAHLCLQAGDTEGLGRLMDLNQMLLSTWMLSTPEIETACAVARSAGAFGAKLTGSGGGGAVVAVGNLDAVVKAWQRAGYPCFGTTLGERSA